ncbi:MAG: PIN domain-containing protein [Acidobacteriota bacterium]|nr:MAG: PIN domain-containing protein [Acidobacteriota bacterium]
MSYAVDTNILARSIQKNHPAQREVIVALEALRMRGEVISTLAQNLYEFWAIATRPRKYNGLGLSIPETQSEITRIKSLFRLLTDTPDIYPEWEQLVIRYSIAGKNAHDARIVAAMRVHGISHLLTFNTDDFKRFQELITVVKPSEVIG